MGAYNRQSLLTVAILASFLVGCGGSDAPSSPTENDPPTSPGTPTPANAASIHGTEAELLWNCSDPEGDALSFDVYLDTVNPPTDRVATGLTAQAHSASDLAAPATYYWRIVAKDGIGQATSPVWSFSTTNDGPTSPANPFPSNASSDVSRDITLTWSSQDTDGDDVSFDIYLDTRNPPTVIASSAATDTVYQPSTLAGNTNYYWQIRASDGITVTAGPIWSFTTEVNLPTLSFIEIAAGTFTMGSPISEPFRYTDRETQHGVTLTRNFLMLSTEVTEELWDAVMDGGWSTSQLPVRPSTFWDALHFCNLLSQIEGWTPVYDLSVPGHATWDPGADGYRLPTEAEWEYACRAGTTTAFHSGAIVNGACNEPSLTLVGWYCQDVIGREDVGLKAPNAWGLYDMHGNVSEWCWDLFQKNYEALPNTDPVGGGYNQNTTLNAGSRIQRGGDFTSTSQNCRAASRQGYTGNIGLRIVRSTN